MGTVHQSHLVKMLRERDDMIRKHHELRAGRKMDAPFTLDGQAADEIDRLQSLLDGRDDFIVNHGLFEAFVKTLK